MKVVQFSVADPTRANLIFLITHPPIFYWFLGELTKSFFVHGNRVVPGIVRPCFYEDLILRSELRYHDRT